MRRKRSREHGGSTFLEFVLVGVLFDLTGWFTT